MSEHEERLRMTVAELERELHAWDTVDDQTRRLLTEAMDEIRAALQAESPTELESESLADRLGEVAHAFEESHPTLSGILSRLLDGLGQMGI